MNTNFKGTGVALITPFKQDFSIDHVALANLVNYNIENGIDYLVVLGTTAESSSLSIIEKKKVVDTIIFANQDRVPLVLGIGGNHTKAVIDTINSTDLSAFKAILSVSPYYNKPTQEGIYQHFKAIAEASPLPIILYNVPSRTSSNTTAETVLKLAYNCNNIIGIKEAAGDIIQIMEIIKDKPKDFLVISGDDMTALPSILAGSDGVISVLGQGIPKQFSAMVNAALQGHVTAAYNSHYKFMTLVNYIFEEGNPAGIKALLKCTNLTDDCVRLPLVNATKELQLQIDKEVRKLDYNTSRGKVNA